MFRVRAAANFLEIKPSESVAGEFEKFTEVVKENNRSGTSTEFNKASQKFMKQYESFTENKKITAFQNLMFNIRRKIKKSNEGPANSRLSLKIKEW